MNRRRASLVLLALGLACFAGLAAHPSALLVDADRPSLDHANPSGTLAVGNDLTRLFLPHHLAIARTLAATGHVPLWDDRGFGGRPLVGNPQAGLFYPPTWLAWWSAAPSALGWLTLGHLFFSGLGTFRLGRTLGLGEWGCLVAAGCVQASPYVLTQTFEGHYPHVWAACWYPWAFDAAIRLRRGERSATPWLALALAATFLTGHLQEGYYLGITLGAWAGFDAVVAIGAGRWRAGGRGLLPWSVAGVLAVGLIGIELVPDALAQIWGLRGARLPLRLAGRYHLYPINALQLLGPGAIGGPSDYFGHENYWETVTSIGLIPLALAVVGVAWSRDRRAVRGWLILVGGAVVFASGRKLGLFAVLFDVVPGMDRFRVPARALFLASLGGSMLAGYGVEALRSRFDDDRAWSRLARRFAVLAALLAMATLVGGRDFSPGHRPTEAGRLRAGLARLAQDPIFLGSLGGTALLLAIGARRPAARRAVAAALGLLGLVELGIHGNRLMVASPADRFLGPDPIGEALRSTRGPGPGPPRIRAVDALYDDLRAGQIGASKANVNDLFQVQHAADLYQSLYRLFDDDLATRGGPMDEAAAARRLATRRAVLDRMAISHLVADHLDPASPWPLVASGAWNGSTYAVHANPSALPRAYVVPRSEPVGDPAQVLPRLLEVDPRRAVLMDRDPLGPDLANRQPFTPAEWASTDPDRLVLQVTTDAPGLLVVADCWMPGWLAEVDGRPEPVLRGNHAQRVVPIRRPGRHEITLIYHPPGFPQGVALTTVSALAWLALVVGRNRKVRFSDFCR